MTDKIFSETLKQNVDKRGKNDSELL